MHIATIVSDTDRRAARQTADEIKRYAEAALADASKMRSILLSTISELQKLHHECGCPVDDYAMDGVFAVLREITPKCDRVMFDKLLRGAVELVAGLDMAAVDESEDV